MPPYVADVTTTPDSSLRAAETSALGEPFLRSGSVMSSVVPLSNFSVFPTLPPVEPAWANRLPGKADDSAIPRTPADNKAKGRMLGAIGQPSKRITGFL